MRERRAAVDTAGIRLSRRALTSPLDVLIDGRRVFSFVPGQSNTAPADPGLLPWPEVLVPYVHGSARVTVMTRAGRTLLDEECVLDSAPGRMRVTDRLGHLQVVDKHGRLQRTFGETGSPDTTALLDQVESALSTLTESGVDAFLTAGALLGAVRDGHLIGHDSDADVAYLSSAATLGGVALESYRLQRVVQRAGLTTRRFSAAEFKLLLPGPSGTTTGVDVRAAWVHDAVLYVAPNVALPGGRGVLVPLGEVKLEGRSLPAPGQPEALLAAMYGPGWPIPDPAFTFDTPAGLTRRLDGWIRGATLDRSAWQRWHLAHRPRRPPAPSSFAIWVAEQVGPRVPLVDLGSGTGDDALWLGASNRWVLGLDYSWQAVAHARSRAAAGETRVHFEECSFGDLRQVLARGARFGRAQTPRSLYARGLIELVDRQTRDNILVLAAMALRRGGRLYVELGDVSDIAVPTVVAENAQPLEPDAFAAEAARRAGRLEHRELAADAGSDPDGVAGTARTRMVFRWQR